MRKIAIAGLMAAGSLALMGGTAFATPSGTDQLYDSSGNAIIPSGSINSSTQGNGNCHGLGSPASNTATGVKVGQSSGSLSLQQVGCGQSGPYAYYNPAPYVQSLTYNYPKAYEIHY